MRIRQSRRTSIRLFHSIEKESRTVFTAILFIFFGINAADQSCKQWRRLDGTRSHVPPLLQMLGTRGTVSRTANKKLTKTTNCRPTFSAKNGLARPRKIIFRYPLRSNSFRRLDCPSTHNRHITACKQGWKTRNDVSKKSAKLSMDGNVKN